MALFISQISKSKNKVFKILGLLGMTVVLPLVLLGIIAYYISLIGGLDVARDIFTQFAINLSIDWATDLMLLFVSYYLLRAFWSKDLDDRNISEDDIKAGKEAVAKAEAMAKEREAKNQAARVRKIKIQRKLNSKRKKMDQRKILVTRPHVTIY